MFHQNECFDWGSYGWILQLIKPLQLSTYTYFVFLNSSIRGPFLPVYWPVSCSKTSLHIASSVPMPAACMLVIHVLRQRHPSCLKTKSMTASACMLATSCHAIYALVTLLFLEHILETCLQRTLHWSHIFKNKLNASVKLVGATISCGGLHKEGDPAKGTRINPHVQSYIAVTDQVSPSAAAHHIGQKSHASSDFISHCIAVDTVNKWLAAYLAALYAA